MQTPLILAAIVRLVSLHYALTALVSGINLPAHLAMLGKGMSDAVKAAGRSGLISDATTIGANALIAVLLWMLAPRLVSFVLGTLSRKTDGPSD